MKLKVYSTSSNNETILVSDEIFGQKVNKQLLSQAVRIYLSNKRQGTSLVKTRSNNNRTKAKVYKQKGTGNARHGSRNAPIFVGGGIAHGPHGETNWTLKLSTIMRKKALISALSGQAKQIVVTKELQELSGKAAHARQIIDSAIETKANRILVVINETKEEMIRSLRNLDDVIVRSVDRINAYDVVNADAILFDQDAIKTLETRLIDKKAKTETAKVEVKAVEKTVKPVKSVKKISTKAKKSKEE
jgi:large subunit ribosomal protein L4